ncbi:MAG: hypothetical protein ACRDL8_14405, partial [Solirubrobacteraceae bacterium]
MKPIFDAARANVERIIRGQMPYSDFAAFEKLLAECPTDPIALRFRRFGATTQRDLLGMLHDDKMIAGARMREAALRATTPRAAAPPAFQAARAPATPASDTGSASRIEATTDRVSAPAGASWPPPNVTMRPDPAQADPTLARSNADAEMTGAAVGHLAVETPAKGSGFAKVGAMPAGAVIASAQLEVALLPHARRTGLAPGVSSITATVLVAGDELVLALQIGSDVYSAELDASAVAGVLVGPAGATQLGSPAELVRSLPGRVRLQGSRLRIALWGSAPNDSFVVLDLARIARGIDGDGLAALRPVEAQILVGNSGVRLFGGDQVKASAAIPGEPIGGWFELPDDPRMRAVLGGEEAHAQGGKLYGGAFYEPGVVRVAVKPAADAQT